MNAEMILRAARATLAGTMSFPEVVAQLMAAGVEYYHVDYVGRCKSFYGAGGDRVVTAIDYEGLPEVAAELDAAALRAAIADSQRNGQAFRDFTRRAMAAGVQGYHAFLRGRRVTYQGRGGDQHTEWFPGAGPGQRPFALRRGEGRTYHFGVDFVVKAGELRAGGGCAVLEYETRRGEEPPDHTHPTEDEMFYVLEGAIAFRCAGETFELEAGGFVFLPRGVKHGYAIRGEEPVRLLVVTSPVCEGAGGWGGFVGEMEGAG